MTKSVLIVEDEAVLRESLAELMAGEGYEVLQAADGKAAYAIVLERPVDVVVTDVRMSGMDGLTLLGHLRQPRADAGDRGHGVRDRRDRGRGHAVGRLRLPPQARAIRGHAAEGPARPGVRRHGPHPTGHHRAIGRAEHVSQSGRQFAIGRQALRDGPASCRNVKSNVVIVGESGTGKELFARAIHYNGVTRGQPFVPVNCGAHRYPDRIGIVRLSPRRLHRRHPRQDRLFRGRQRRHVVSRRDFHPADRRAKLPASGARGKSCGAGRRYPPAPIDVRIIAASNQDLEKMVEQRLFREDLLFRLNVVKLQLPPLRQRKEDIPLLVHHFLIKYTREMNKKMIGITNGAMRAMLSHHWRGNIRELENVIERAVIFADGREIGVEDLPFSVEGISDDVGEDLKTAMEHFERQHILYSLSRHNYDKAETAKSLGIGVSSLYRKLDELKIGKQEGEADQKDAAATE